ncbi:SAM-dependent methyltransferase [Membranihabitans marinus]|uniref:SAM-dependent methyltransferase n=1 Tax=Membranihabitans marinus TaxID=1227546 RepID=UPI001F426DC4|nr:SAM-dependent methyltransferase [Membranihabitans marinus]
MNSNKLYLIPTAIGALDRPSPGVLEIINEIEVFFCERIRTTRRWLRDIQPDYDIDSRTFIEFDKHSNRFPMDLVLEQWKKGRITGLTSEAGSPAIADPGFQIVIKAHQLNIPVLPLSGSNSLILALMGSGFNGNQFTYQGYFPIKPQELKSKIQKILPSIEKGYTQIFIETPYRNIKTMESLIDILPDTISISLAIDLLNTNNTTVTKTVKQWRSSKLPSMHKLPCVFVLGKGN